MKSPCTALLLILCILAIFSGCTTMSPKKGAPSGEEEIWALEHAYFSNLYAADYDGVLKLVHPQFLGWPDSIPAPLDYNESARFMKQLVSGPAPCTITIDRKGIRVQEDLALTQYVLHATCSSANGTAQTKSSDITHTWVHEGSGWQLLGGMSRDIA